MIQYSIREPRKQRPIQGAPFHEYLLEDGTAWTRFYRLQPGYLLRFPSLADFHVSQDGTVVTAGPVPGIDGVTVEHLYLNQVVPLALSRQGRPAFHASVVTAPGGCVAFLGRTGMGKSTLAASFSLAGSAFLTDDALLVTESRESVEAVPSHRSLRLWADSLSALARTDAPRMAATSYSDKTRLLADDHLAFCDAPLPLRAAYLLKRSEPTGVTIRPLAGVERHMAWVENSFLLDIEDRDLVARHFDWTHRIAMRVPTFALDYPRDYGKLAEVRQAVLGHVGQTGD